MLTESRCITPRRSAGSVAPGLSSRRFGSPGTRSRSPTGRRVVHRSRGSSTCESAEIASSLLASALDEPELRIVLVVTLIPPHEVENYPPRWISLVHESTARGRIGQVGHGKEASAG